MFSKKWSVLIMVLAASNVSAQTMGVVIKADGDCPAGYDRMVIETRSGYVLAEHYRGTFYEGRRVYGNLHSYGFEEVIINDREAKIYIEDYMASNDEASNWCFNEDE